MKTYLVGGAVRDSLLNYPFHERDWVVVGGTPQQLIDQGYQQVGSDFPVFLHPKSKEEYALARTERKSGPGYTGFDCYASSDVTLEQDLLRRDLTINAIAQQDDGSLVDPYGGQRDIDNKILRHVSPAFAEDPLRILRVARFNARYAHLGFTIAPETLALMQSISASGELLALPAERVWKELEKALNEKNPQCFFTVLKAADALLILMPELLTCDFSILEAAAKNSQDPAVRFAVLFADSSDASSRSLCERIKAPNLYRDLALLCSQQLGQQNLALESADGILTVLEQCDVFRKPERFQQFLNCLDIATGTPTQSNLLRSAFNAIQAINVKALLEQGLKGKAIATGLREKRLQKIEQEIIND